MFSILCSLCAILAISKPTQAIPSLEPNDNTNRAIEKTVLERLIRIERIIQRLVKDTSQGHASTYVRWGKTTCPGNDTELVYKGFAAGSHFQHSGGAADFVCLPDVPTWGKHVGGTGYAGFIYGAEYELYSGSNPFSTVSIEDDASCCVCRPPRTTTIMVPGRTDCYTGWNQEYTGYLMSGYYGHAGNSNYVCVDANSDPGLGGFTNYNGHLMYVVQAQCGSLPCPPYVQGRVIACVVCSK
ncbi:hypothetical protein CHS0354_014463 [Potamilus streckersoni]|uniref:Short-chain collagen C4-like n=1 Tax=Potamilus streckersoni TaxID=2493646 RepID=A0AAE0SAC6_9BIVA|nr:hypothetical protein CHS0354_014463 [Potamilus streckersoni]